MIYCFKKMRELRLTHLFFLHYALALIIGGAAITGLFVLGGGLQFYSIVVLCYMYTQPTFFLLRRMKMYEVRQEIKYGDYSPCEKADLAMQAWYVMPHFDEKAQEYFEMFFVDLLAFSLCAFFFNTTEGIVYYSSYLIMLADFLGLPCLLSFAKAPHE